MRIIYNEITSINLKPDDFAAKLIAHPNKEYIEKMSSQFNRGFGSIKQDGGILSFAQIKERKESQ